LIYYAKFDDLNFDLQTRKVILDIQKEPYKYEWE